MRRKLQQAVRPTEVQLNRVRQAAWIDLGEAAQILGIPYSTIHGWMHRAGLIDTLSGTKRAPGVALAYRASMWWPQRQADTHPELEPDPAPEPTPVKPMLIVEVNRLITQVNIELSAIDVQLRELTEEQARLANIVTRLAAVWGVSENGEAK